MAVSDELRIPSRDRADFIISSTRLQVLLTCGIFHRQNTGNPLLQSALIEVLILLRDLMYKTEKYARRINFTDDVTIIKDQVEDVTSLIEYVRNALCHIHSDKHYVEKERNILASYNVLFGKGATLLKIGDFEQSNPYEDDICFFYGLQRIFFKRHIVRAFNESLSLLSPLLKD
jgi:hypothetical protein